jgi:hypothetical protein
MRSRQHRHRTRNTFWDDFPQLVTSTCALRATVDLIVSARRNDGLQAVALKRTFGQRAFVKATVGSLRVSHERRLKCRFANARPEPDFK